MYLHALFWVCKKTIMANSFADVLLNTSLKPESSQQHYSVLHGDLICTLGEVRWPIFGGIGSRASLEIGLDDFEGFLLIMQ
jgi:hypothetical protein